MSARTNFFLDLVIFAGFLVAYNPPLTGIAVHEWLGIAFLATLVGHLLVHWQWVATVTRRLFDRPARGSRLDYAVDLLLFVALTATVVSGVMISRSVLATFGLSVPRNRAWRQIHEMGADASLAALAVHVGLHFEWVMAQGRRMLGGATRRAGAPAPSLAPDASE
jgi:uncharacterized membrane protein YhaH (DUF805 family)